jgi:ABC-2 type transport system permease protein
MSLQARKYIYRIQQSIIRSFEYRAELVGWIILSILPNVILLLVWQNIYSSHDTLAGYDLSSILQYYLISTLIGGITASHFENKRSIEIRQGKIDYHMTRPLPYPTEILLADIGGKIVYNAMALPSFFACFWLLSFVFPLGSLTFDIANVSQFVLLLFFGYCVEFCMALIAVLLTFWFEGADGLEHFKWMLITILSGAMIPFAFMPKWLLSIINVLPFKYMYAFPISVLQHRAVIGVNDLLYMAATVIGLYLILSALWKRAMYKYTSAGG